MLIGAKITLRKLMYDDSGVAMAYTVLVSLFIFMLCVSTYAMTDNIRKKMELQNACDAAAYSGAVVQADMLSRIAVLNRALAWTYAQNSKRHMDYVISVWINDIDTAYTRYRDAAISSGDEESNVSVEWPYSRQVTCSKCGGSGQYTITVGDKTVTVSCSKTETEYKTITYPPSSNDSRYVSRPTERSGVRSYSHCWGCGGKHDPSAGTTLFTGITTAGWFLGWDSHEGVNLNYNNTPPNDDVQLTRLTEQRRTLLADGTFMTRLANERTNITKINAAIDYLRSNLNVFTAAAIRNTMNQNIDTRSINYTWNCGTTWNSTDAPTYLVNIAQDTSIQNQEAYFLNYNGHSDSEFGTGSNTWWTDKTDTSGIKRGYTQTATALVGRLRYWANVWGRDPWSNAPCHYLMTVLDGTSHDITPGLPGNFVDMLPANPVRLTQRFFGKDGAIVVTAKRTVSNPFAAFLGANANSALYGAFNGTGQDMWAISAARAGVNLGRGGYEVRWPGDRVSSSYNSNNIWNLCEEDWDAVMLPIARAWNDTDDRAWGAGEGQTINDTTTALLNSARETLRVRTPYVNPIANYNPFNPEAVKR